MSGTGRRPLSERARRYRRVALWTLLGMVLGALIAPLGGYVYVGITSVSAQAGDDANPRANYWRAVRSGLQGYTAVTGKTMPDAATSNDWKNMETDVLVSNGGQNWRQLRNGLLARWGGGILLVVLFAIFVFFAFRGSVPLEGGRSGRRLLRWQPWERGLHWYTAALFVVLGVTGLSLLFGRLVLIPVLGPEGFAAWAGTSRMLHEVLGPWFGGGVALMIIFWIGRNIPNRDDWTWFLQGGGIVGKAHPRAGFANAGEKVWFWFVVIVGGMVILTGLTILGITGNPSRDSVQLAHLWHTGGGLAWIALWFGHAYIGTLGSEGSLEAMTTGYVDEKWAKQHHDQWYETVKDQVVDAPPAAPGKGRTEQPAAT